MRISDWSSDVCSSDLLVLFGYSRYRRVGGAHHGFQAMIDFGLDPVEAGEVLHPFEVAYRDPACVGQYVGDDQRAIRCQDIVGQIGRASCRERVWQYV